MTDETRFVLLKPGDVMPAKYQRTHPVLCAVASALCAEDVERAIQHFTERGRTDD